MNFGQMKTKVSDYLNRSDLSAIVPDFINSSIHHLEKKHNFNYMLSATETFSLVDGTYEYDVPSGYKAVSWFKWDDNGDLVDLVKKSESEATRYYPDYTNDTGDPELYSYLPATSKFLIRPTPDDSYTAYMRYWAFSADLSADEDTHWLLTNFWEVVLYGALKEAAPYLRDDNRIILWTGLYKEAIKELRDYEFDEGVIGSENTSEPTYPV